MERTQIAEDTAIVDRFNAMTEGNKDAVVALNTIFRDTETTPTDFADILQKLDDMNIRGAQIGYAFTEIFNKDVSQFRLKLYFSQADLIDPVNEHFKNNTEMTYKAVYRNAREANDFPKLTEKNLS